MQHVAARRRRAPCTRGRSRASSRTRCRGSPASTWSSSPGPARRRRSTTAGVITATHTYSEVNIDQLFDTFDPLTRAGLRSFIQGEAASLDGRGVQANQALKYLAPGLQTHQPAHRRAHPRPADVRPARGAGRQRAERAGLAQRPAQPAHRQHEHRHRAPSPARARRSSRRSALLPGTLHQATTTFAGLQTTLDSLDPLVAASKPAVRQLPEFLASLRKVIDASVSRRSARWTTSSTARRAAATSPRWPRRRRRWPGSPPPRSRR